MFKTTLTQFLTVFAILFGFAAVNAQTIFSENFDTTAGTALPTGFTTTGAATTLWTTGVTADATSGYIAVPTTNTSRFAFVNDDICNCTMNDARMILPVQDFTGYPGMSLNFSYFSQQYYGAEWSVEVSTDSGATWTSIYVDGANAGWTTQSINLSAYAGMSGITIAFRYDDKGTWAGAILIDDITLEVTPNFDLAVGLQVVDGNGWTLDYPRLTGYQYQPVSQLVSSELLMGATVTNRGLQSATNAYVRLNIDRQTGPGAYTNVFTDTLQYGTIQSDSSVWNVKGISDTTWATTGFYRYQYIMYQDSTDEKPNSDTITDFFTLTDNMWSKVDLASDGGPFGDNAYMPGVTAGEFCSMMDWGTIYYFPNGANYVLDTCMVRFFSSSTAAATQGIYQIRISEITWSGAAALDITTDKQLSALVSDTVAITPGASILREVANFVDINTFAEFEFESGKMYYISIYQQIQNTPGLSDGTVRNGLYPYGQTINHDAGVYSPNSVGFGFYNPLIIEMTPSAGAPTTTAYEYGWSGGAEPAIVLKLRSTIVANDNVKATELSGVEVFPNPAGDYFTVNVSIDNAEVVKYILSDVAGRVADVKVGNNVSNDTQTFDIARYPAGVYFLTVIADGVKTTKRIIKK